MAGNDVGDEKSRELQQERMGGGCPELMIVFVVVDGNGKIN